MGFDSLLGNDQLKQELSRSVGSGKGSHAYLISGPAGSGKHTLAKLLAAALECTGSSKPCMACSGCRKVLDGVHPDVITVDEPEKKNVSIELVRRALADMVLQPNEGQKKIYIFPRAQDMMIPAQNALLKMLEEPPAYGAFFLLVDNPGRLLPTIRSRCVELKLQPVEKSVLVPYLRKAFPQAALETVEAAAEGSGGFPGQAKALLEQGLETPEEDAEFVRCFAGKDVPGLLELLYGMEKRKRDEFSQTVLRWRLLLEQALHYQATGTGSPLARKIASARTGQDILAAISQLKQTSDLALGNVNVGALCCRLFWFLRGQFV